MIDLYQALRNDDRDLAVHAYETWGFKGLSREVIDVLNRWARFVYGPLMEDRERAIQEAETGVYGREVAERRACRAAPPRPGHAAARIRASWTAPRSAWARCSCI